MKPPSWTFLAGVGAGQLVWLFWIALQLVMEWEQLGGYVVIYCCIAAVQVCVAFLIALAAHAVAVHLKEGMAMVKEDIAYWRSKK